MGDFEEVYAEPDELEDGDIEGVHPPTLEQTNPKVVTSTVNTVLWFLASNGWYIVIFFGIGMFAWKNLEPVLKGWLRRREEEREASLHHKNPDILLNKLRIMDEARRKLQEKYNLEAAKNLEKKLERERIMKEQKHAEWLSMQGKNDHGHRLRDEPKATANSASASSSAKGKETNKKAKLRPEYNPMTGDTGASSACQWRPSRRGPSAGGG